jgi:ABC-type sugar transport system ATPase subunit
MDAVPVEGDGRIAGKKHRACIDAVAFPRRPGAVPACGAHTAESLLNWHTRGRKKDFVRPPGERILQVSNLRVGNMVRNNSLSVFAGQVTGVFGLVGSGRTETFKVVAGVIKRNYLNGGEVFIRGKRVRYRV